MGNSLHNKIHLGRRTALFNLKRLRIAGLCAVSLGAAAMVALALTR